MKFQLHKTDHWKITLPKRKVYFSCQMSLHTASQSRAGLLTTLWYQGLPPLRHASASFPCSKPLPVHNGCWFPITHSSHSLREAQERRKRRDAKRVAPLWKSTSNLQPSQKSHATFLLTLHHIRQSPVSWPHWEKGHISPWVISELCS